MNDSEIEYNPYCIYYITTQLPNFNKYADYENLKEFIGYYTDPYSFEDQNLFIGNTHGIEFISTLEQPTSDSKLINYKDIENSYSITGMILDRFIFNNYINALPQVFKIDTSFKKSNQFIKVFVTKESIDMIFNFIMNIQKDYIALQERLYNNNNYGSLFNLNLGKELSIIDQVMSKTHNKFINPNDPKNIVLIDNNNDNKAYEHETYYHNTLSFYKDLINNFYNYNIDTYYICINCIGYYSIERY